MSRKSCSSACLFNPFCILLRASLAAPSFSLLGDLAEEELDLDMGFDEDAEVQDALQEGFSAQTQPVAAPATRSGPPSTDAFNPDPNLPFFLPMSKRAASFSAASRSRDPFLRLAGLSHVSSNNVNIDASARTFHRPPDTPQEQEKRMKRWEQRKAELTGEWKRRHREAVKKRKRGYEGARRAGAV